MTRSPDSLTVDVRPIDTLSEDPANVRTHPQRNLDAIKASLRRFGQQKPIIVGTDGTVRAGNGTFRAARELGWETIAVIESDLSGAELSAYAITDNRTTDLSGWEYEALGAQLKALVADDVDLLELGWAQFELDPLLDADWTPDSTDDDGLDGRGPSVRPIIVTPEQRERIARAVASYLDTEDVECSEGEAVARICDLYAGAD